MPGTVGAPALNVSVDVPPAVTVLGLNAALVPFGTPLAPNETLSAEPLVTVVVIVDEALPPWPALTRRWRRSARDSAGECFKSS